MDKIDAIIEIVANKWETSDIVHAWNLMLEGKEVRCKIFPMSSFNEMFNGKSHLEVIKMVHNCQFGVDDDYFSFNADGDIESFSDITIAFGENKHEAYIIYLNTAIGTLPTLAGKEMFDMQGLSKGKIIGMNAYIKANFVKDKYPQK